MAAREREEMKREVAAHAQQQRRELLETYQELGMDPVDARTVVSIFSKYQEIMVDEKMAIQRGIVSPKQTEKPWKSAFVTCAAFLLFGSFPLISFVILIPFTDNDSVKFAGACVLSAVALALLGLAKAKISGQNYMFSTIITLLNGAVAAASAYLVGWILRNVAGLKD